MTHVERRDAGAPDREVRLYRLLLRLYPRDFRKAHGTELEAFVAALRQERRYCGAQGRLRLWRELVTDLAASASRLRWERVARRKAPAAAKLRTARAHHHLPLRDRMHRWLQDLRFAVRVMRLHPAASLAAIVSLSLGIGGNALVFGVVDNLVLNPLPYPRAERLVAVGPAFPRLREPLGFVEVLSPAESYDIAGLRSLERVVIFDLGNRNLSGGDRAERVFAALLWGDPFDTLGLAPALGRGLGPADWREGAEPVVVLSDGVWRNRFGGDRSLVGRSVRINGVATTVIGIMPPAARLMGTDIWLPLPASPERWPRNARQFNVFARLAEGYTLAQANAELARLAVRTAMDFEGQFPEYDGWHLEAMPLARALTGRVRPMAFLLLGAVGFVLLLACANVSNLQVAVASSRARELSIRTALGASRSMLAQQLFLESAMLATVGGVLGLLLAYVGLGVIQPLLPARAFLLSTSLEIDGRAIAYTFAISSVVGLLVGVFPALRAARRSVVEPLKTEMPSATADRATLRLRQGLVLVQVSLALVLLAGAGLFTRSFMAVQRIDPGLDPSNVLTMRLTLPWEKYEGEAVTRFFDTLVERVRALPGVRGASVASQFPPGGFFSRQFRLEGVAAEGETLPSALTTVVSPEYFETLGVPIVSGRGLSAADRARAPAVVLVNSTLASRFFPDGTAVGRRLRIGDADSTAPWAEIVGVVEETRNRGLTLPPDPEIFVTVQQDGGRWNQLFLLVRSEGEPDPLLPAVRQVVASLDADQPLYAVQTYDRILADESFNERTSAVVMSLLAAVALSLAAVGLYGVLAWMVTARTREVGIRMALGAQARDVLRGVLRQALTLVAAGIVLGTAGALLLGQAVAGMLVDVTAVDPLTLGLGVIMLLVVGATAAWVPAYRAGRVDPVVALREP